MRMIDADELKEHLFVGADYDKAINDGIGKTEEEVFAFKCGWNDALKSVAEFAPTVDPVKHGHWIIRDIPGTYFYQITCSECSEDVTSSAPCIGFLPNAKVLWDYCPYCGAKMDEVEKDEQE